MGMGVIVVMRVGMVMMVMLMSVWVLMGLFPRFQDEGFFSRLSASAAVTHGRSLF
jgi:hypothetical protein